MGLNVKRRAGLNAGWGAWSAWGLGACHQARQSLGMGARDHPVCYRPSSVLETINCVRTGLRWGRGREAAEVVKKRLCGKDLAGKWEYGCVERTWLGRGGGASTVG